MLENSIYKHKFKIQAYKYTKFGYKEGACMLNERKQWESPEIQLLSFGKTAAETIESLDLSRTTQQIVNISPLESSTTYNTGEDYSIMVS